MPSFQPIVLSTLLLCTPAIAAGATATHDAQRQGLVIMPQGYVQHAKVCLDTNLNGRCDSGEAMTRSDKQGRFTLPAGPLVAEIGQEATATAPAGRVQRIGQPLILRSPSGSNGTISLISTQIQAQMDDLGGDLSLALNRLALRLKIDPALLMADPFQLADARAREKLFQESEQSIARIQDAMAEAHTGNTSYPLALRNRFALDRLRHIVVIYAENRAFDNLYGHFPGADNIKSTRVIPQKDFDGSVLPKLPPAWGGATASHQSNKVTQTQTQDLPNQPYPLETTLGLGLHVPTRDLVHRFYNHQMQIHGGKNDLFAAYSDAGGLTLGYYDGSQMALWKIAKDYVLADRFFQGAFGGSFLNHQYLVCACAPYYPDYANAAAKPSVAQIELDSQGQFLRLKPATGSPTSALLGPPQYAGDGTLTPDHFAVNTMQPPYQPSGVRAAATGSNLLADPNHRNTLPPQTTQTLGDQLSSAGISWAWYSGSWQRAVADGLRPASEKRSVIYAGDANFQPHHQPLNYYLNFAPGTQERADHLLDYEADFITAIKRGNLPAVAFYKPQGNVNQHADYSNVLDGDRHIAEVIGMLQKSPQWKDMLIIVTYDENGGWWDHVPPPKGDRWGPGTRIPAIFVSPHVKKGFVDQRQYDTGSIARLIEHRYSLPPLEGISRRDTALIAAGGQSMGDLTNALDFGPLANAATEKTW